MTTDARSKTIFGFWVYLLSDVMMFAAIFATFVVLQNSTAGGVTGKQIFNLGATYMQTLFLLASAFTSGLATIMAHRGKLKATALLFGLTFLLGAIFLFMQCDEFYRLVSAGHGWQESAFLSAFFTLVGTHALHMIFALLWVVVFLALLYRDGLSEVMLTRLTCLRMFWQVLNIVWIFIFSIVYVLGVN